MSEQLAKIHQQLAKAIKQAKTGHSPRSLDVKLVGAANSEMTLYLAVSYLESYLADSQLTELQDANVVLNNGTPSRVSIGTKRPYAIGVDWKKLEAIANAEKVAAMLKVEANKPKPQAVEADEFNVSLASCKVSSAKVILLENRVRNLEKELKDAKDASAVDIALVNLLETVGSHYTRGKIKAPPAPTSRQRKSDSHEGVAALVLSDWHWGERVDKESINGLNEYNVAIADRRASRIFEKSLEMLNPMPGKYDALLLPFLGDMLSGIIHEELVATNDGSVIESILSLLTKLEAGLLEYAKYFPQVQVVATYGNHGRMDRRKTHKSQSSLNYETLVFRLLEKHLKSRMGDNCNIHFKIATASDVSVQVYDKTYLLTHGDQFDNNPGTSLDRVRAGDAAKRKRAQDAKQPVHDLLICGHYHQYAAIGNIITNGSLVGYTEFAYNNNLTLERPQQALFVQHPALGIIRHSAVFADAPVAANNIYAPVGVALTI